MKAKRRGGCRKKHIKTHEFSTRKVKGDFGTSILINNTEIEVLVDTGTDVNVISHGHSLSMGLHWKKM